MSPKQLITVCTAFLVTFLFTSGCSAYASWPEARTEQSNDTPDATHATDAAPTADWSIVHDHPITILPEPMNMADGSVARADASSSDTARPDAHAPSDDRPLPIREPQAFLLAPTTCHGRRLPLTTSGLTLAHDGVTLWHLCYKTPSPAHSMDPLARLRAQTVLVNIVTQDDATHELLRVNAPMTANPWTVSAIVALPAGQPPSLELINLYEGERRVSAVTADVSSVPVINGELQSWNVAMDGTQTSTPPVYACHDPLDARGDPAFFLPRGSCSRLQLDCPLLEHLRCRAFE